MRTCAWGLHMPGLYRIQVVDRIKMVDNTNVINRKELEMPRSELLWSLPGTQTLFFFRLPCHRRIKQLFNPVNVLISKFFTGQTDRLTDGQNQSLNPVARMHARGNYAV